MIKRFKFLVIILVVSIYSIINCGGSKGDLGYAIIFNEVDFDSLTPEQDACYRPQIHKKGIAFMPIELAYHSGNLSAFKWLLSNGAKPDQKCFTSAILTDSFNSEILSILLSRKVYYPYIGDTRTSEILEYKLATYTDLANKNPGMYQADIAQAKKYIDLIKEYKDQMILGWVRPSVGVGEVSDGASYAGAGSGAREIKE